jgi:hypothetical protein
MKNLKITLIIFSALCSSNNAYASEIYKCIDEQAQISFSFTPCPSRETSSTDEQVGMTVEEQLDQLELIDREISRINRQFRDLKLEQAYSLESNKDIQAERQIRTDYMKSTQELLDKLFAEKEKRGQLVQASVTLLNQPHS